jgi:hypothetical protein
MATAYMRQMRDEFRTKQLQQLTGGGGIGRLNRHIYDTQSRVYGKLPAALRPPLEDGGSTDVSQPRTNIQTNVASSLNENRAFDVTPKATETTRVLPQPTAPNQLQRNFLPLHRSTPYQSTL